MRFPISFLRLKRIRTAIKHRLRLPLIPSRNSGTHFNLREVGTEREISKQRVDASLDSAVWQGIKSVDGTWVLRPIKTIRSPQLLVGL